MRRRTEREYVLSLAEILLAANSQGEVSIETVREILGSPTIVAAHRQVMRLQRWLKPRGVSHFKAGYSKVHFDRAGLRRFLASAVGDALAWFAPSVPHAVSRPEPPEVEGDAAEIHARDALDAAVPRRVGVGVSFQDRDAEETTVDPETDPPIDADALVAEVRAREAQLGPFEPLTAERIAALERELDERLSEGLEPPAPRERRFSGTSFRYGRGVPAA